MNYKNYKVIALEENNSKEPIKQLIQLGKSGVTTFMPRKAITTSLYFPRMMSFRIVKGGETTHLARALFSHASVCGTFIQGKGCVRAMFKENISPVLFNEICGLHGHLCYEISTNNNTMKWSPPRENNTVIIKRTDGNPITQNSLATVALVFQLVAPVLRAGAVFGKMKNAKASHDCCVGSWVVLWLGEGKEREDEETTRARTM